MSDEKRTSIGKITSVSFGFGGYQDVQFGISISVQTETGSACTGRWMWTNEPDKHTKWTVADQDAEYANIMRYIIELMSKAKVDRVQDLKGKPIEAIWDGNWLEEIRILTEVIL